MLLIYTRWLPEACQRRSLSGGQREGGRERGREATSRPTVKLSTFWLTRQKIGCSPPLFSTHTTFSARSSPLSSPDGLASASELIQWRKSWGGQGGTVPSKVLTGGTAVLTVPPPKFKLRRDTAGSCFVRSHKEYITYYNFESAIVKLQFPLCILTSGESRGYPSPLTKPFKKLKSVILFKKFIKCIHAYIPRLRFTFRCNLSRVINLICICIHAYYVCVIRRSPRPPSRKGLISFGTRSLTYLRVLISTPASRSQVSSRLAQILWS